MSDKGNNMEGKVLEWLRKSGYPLELFAHDKLKKSGYICEKSPYYTDVETGVEREIDIWAEKSFSGKDGQVFLIALLVECKKSEKPLVILSSDDTTVSVRSEVFGAGVVPSAFCNESIIAEVGFALGPLSKDNGQSLSRTVRPGYSVLQAFKNTDEVFHRTLYGLAKSEHYFEQQYEELFKSFLENKDIEEIVPCMHIPLLVVDAPLYSAYLDGEDLNLEKTDWGSVTLNLPWTPRPQSEKRSNIQVLTKDSLPRFFEELDGFGSAAADLGSWKNSEKYPV